MAKRRHKMGLPAQTIAAIVLIPLGLLFLIGGRYLVEYLRKQPNLIEEDISQLSRVFGLIGIVFLGIGVLLVLWVILKVLLAHRAIKKGHFVKAKLVRVYQNYSVSVRGLYPYVVECSYTDPESGKTFKFRSKNIFYDPEPLMTSDEIPVYAEPPRYRPYFVDIDAVQNTGKKKKKTTRK